MEEKDLITILLPAGISAFVTITGFILTYFLNKRNFIEEVKKQKVNINTNKFIDAPYKIQEIFDSLLQNKDEDVAITEYKTLMRDIFAYGSKDAIKIASQMQQTTYLGKDNVDKNKLIAYYILLLCQVKYDLTEIKINPQYWYRLRLNDYCDKQTTLDSLTNKIVKDLSLEDFLKI